MRPLTVGDVLAEAHRLYRGLRLLFDVRIGNHSISGHHPDRPVAASGYCVFCVGGCVAELSRSVAAGMMLAGLMRGDPVFAWGGAVTLLANTWAAWSLRWQPRRGD